MIWKLDRLGRNLKHLIETVEDLTKRGVGSIRRPVRRLIATCRMLLRRLMPRASCLSGRGMESAVRISGTRRRSASAFKPGMVLLSSLLGKHRG